MDEGVDELADCEVFAFGEGNDAVSEVLIREAEGAAEAVTDEVFGEAVGEVFFTGGDEVTEILKVAEFRAVVECSGGVDFPGLPFGPTPAGFGAVIVNGTPFSGGIEIFEPEANGIDLAVATGTLGFLHVGGEFLSGGKGLVGESGKLRDIGWSRRWRIVEEVAEYPGTSFNRTTFDTVTAHGVNGGHTQQSAARGTRRELHFAELVTIDTFDAVVVGEKAIDHDVVALEEFAEAAFLFITKEMGERLVNFLAGS